MCNWWTLKLGYFIEFGSVMCIKSKIIVEGISINDNHNVIMTCPFD